MSQNTQSITALSHELNPEKLAKELGIIVLKQEYSPVTKGYFIRALRNKFIVVNTILDWSSQQIVLAHELGHALLHSSQDIYFIREYTLFPMGKYEVQANKFAAELLIDDSEIRKDLSVPELSQYFGVPEKLIKYKLCPLGAMPKNKKGGIMYG